MIFFSSSIGPIFLHFFYFTQKYTLQKNLLDSLVGAHFLSKGTPQKTFTIPVNLTEVEWQLLVPSFLKLLSFQYLFLCCLFQLPTVSHWRWWRSFCFNFRVVVAKNLRRAPITFDEFHRKSDRRRRMHLAVDISTWKSITAPGGVHAANDEPAHRWWTCRKRWRTKKRGERKSWREDCLELWREQSDYPRRSAI